MAAAASDPIKPAVPRCIGESLWRGGPLREAPDCEFFQRFSFAVAALPTGMGLYVLGGREHNKYYNDIWLLELSAQGARWTEVSKQEDVRESRGRTVISKWAGRERFSATIATMARRRRAVYVCGGQGARQLMTDFWASEDGGSTWYCMRQEVPFGGRLEPGLIGVPAHYEQLVVCGGMSVGDWGAQMNMDIWVSGDAGMNWEELRAPSFEARCEPRCAPLLAFVPGALPGGVRRLLVLGGTCMVKNTAGGFGIREGVLGDAWEARINVIAKDATWRQLGDPAHLLFHDGGVNRLNAAFDPSWKWPEVSKSTSEVWTGRGAVVALIEGCLCVAPPVAPFDWVMAGPADSPLLRGAQSPVLAMALAAGPRAILPRLFAVTADGVFASTTSEVARQRRWLLRLGQALDAAGRMPVELWRWRVLPALLPAGQAAPAAAAGRASSALAVA